MVYRLMVLESYGLFIKGLGYWVKIKGYEKMFINDM